MGIFGNACLRPDMPPESESKISGLSYVGRLVAATPPYHQPRRRLLQWVEISAHATLALNGMTSPI